MHVIRLLYSYSVTVSSVGAMFVCFLYSILFMKLWSYVQVNSWCRNGQKENSTHKTRSRSQSISIAELRKFISVFVLFWYVKQSLRFLLKF